MSRHSERRPKLYESCEACGRAWRGKVNRTRDRIYYRYVCNSAERGIGTSTCTVHSVSGPALEGRVWERVASFLTNPEVFLGAVADHQRAQALEVEQVHHAVGDIERRLRKVEDAEARAFSSFARGLASEDAYQRVRAELPAEQRRLTEEFGRHQAARSAAEQQSETAEMVKRLYPLRVQRIEGSSFEDKRFVLECLDTQVRIGPSGIVVSLAVPDRPVASAKLVSVSNAAGRAGWGKPSSGASLKVARANWRTPGCNRFQGLRHSPLTSVIESDEADTGNARSDRNHAARGRHR